MPSRQLITQSLKPKLGLTFLTITILAPFLILFTILYFLYYYFIHRSRTTPRDSSPSPPLFVKLHCFTYKELKSATKNFSSHNLIGKGGSGTVYLGTLKNGKSVAVKLLDHSFQADIEFHNELQVLGGMENRSPFIISLLGYCVEKGRMLVVYEYMPNKSLQENLFSESINGRLSWERRFQIILDVSRALAFLHKECDPPVVHGDVKPSNVLLDSEYRAKLSDFGLSRLKVEGEFGVDMFSGDLGKSQDLSGIEARASSVNEEDFAPALQASSLSTNKGLSFSYSNQYGGDRKDMNVKGKGKEVLVNIENGGEGLDNASCDDDQPPRSIEQSRELDINADFAVVDISNHISPKDVKKTRSRKEWWWKQDGSGELSTRDYVREWIGSQCCSSFKPDCDEDKWKSPRKPKKRSEKDENTNRARIQGQGIKRVDDDRGWKPRKKRKMQEWWKEEHLDELSRKTNNRPKKEMKSAKKRFKLSSLSKVFKRKISRETDHDEGDPTMEFSFRKMSKKKSGFSGGSEMWSGELSTTSTRGTLCYVAPDYGGSGHLMEKADIYSLGVLILVIVSGRRPLHVLASPMKLERANLINWCRQLAQNGNVLELVDSRLKDDRFNKEQANLCINLGLACLQKNPEMRPDIGEIIQILSGEMDLQPPPFEFSPSPPSIFVSRN